MNAEYEEMDTYSAGVHAMFQYMISNMDWSVPMLHNVKLLQYDNGHKMTPIPYDFDFSGLVDAPYAIPNPDLDITDVKHRVYMGTKMNAETLHATTTLYFAKKDDILKNYRGATLYQKKDEKGNNTTDIVLLSHT